MERQNLLDLDLDAMASWCMANGHKPFRARQLMQAIHTEGLSDFGDMTTISRSMRDTLAATACVRVPGILRDHVSADGTRKWLVDVGMGNAVEMVFIPEIQRGTLCISSQAGCAVDCRFCSTGKQGFSRNLTTGEVVGQLWLANKLLRESGGAARPITNVVLMGMGEPLLNYQAVVPALRLMLDDHGYGLSRRRVTVSTSGVVPMIDRLRDDCPVALAVSLHAPNDALRDELVPLNRKYPLADLLAACRRYLQRAPRDFVTFEYVMLGGINDGDRHARELVALVRDTPCKFNLIPFNPFPGSGLRVSSRARIHAFGEILLEAGLVTTIRKTRGDDIDAACGQLAGEVRDRTRLVERKARVIPVVPAATHAEPA